MNSMERARTVVATSQPPRLPRHAGGVPRQLGGERARRQRPHHRHLRSGVDAEGLPVEVGSHLHGAAGHAPTGQGYDTARAAESLRVTQKTVNRTCRTSSSWGSTRAQYVASRLASGGGRGGGSAAGAGRRQVQVRRRPTLHRPAATGWPCPRGAASHAAKGARCARRWAGAWPSTPTALRRGTGFTMKSDRTPRSPPGADRCSAGASREPEPAPPGCG